MASDNGGHHSRVSDVPPDTVAAPEVLPKRCPCGQLIGMDASTQATFWKVCREVSVQCSLQRMPPLPLPTEVSHQPSELLTGNEVPDSPRKDNTAQLFAVNNTSKRSKPGRPSKENPLRLTARHFPQRVPPTAGQGNRTQRRCHVCANTSRRRRCRKDTRYMCIECDRALCVEPCFQEYHTLKNF